jgi:hypothetical protein
MNYNIHVDHRRKNESRPHIFRWSAAWLIYTTKSKGSSLYLKLHRHIEASFERSPETPYACADGHNSLH